VVEDALGRFNDRITRVEVHLSDQSGPKDGQRDKRCMMEVRLRGRQPTAVTHQAKTLNQAIDGAADKLRRSVASGLGRMQSHE
jgi:ribosome-associated translation inhibitor RaiA